MDHAMCSLIFDAASAKKPETQLWLMCRLEAPQYPSSPSANFPIHIDEQKGSVTVAAGISQRLLLDYLANYK